MNLSNMTTLQFTDVINIATIFILSFTIVYQYFVIKRQSRTIKTQEDSIKHLNKLLSNGLLNEMERSWNLFFDIAKGCNEIENKQMSQTTTEKPKKKVAKKTTKKV